MFYSPHEQQFVALTEPLLTHEAGPIAGEQMPSWLSWKQADTTFLLFFLWTTGPWQHVQDCPSPVQLQPTFFG